MAISLPAMTADPSADLVPLLDAVAEGRPLTAGEAERAFDRFMDGSATEIQMAGFLLGVQARGVTSAEVAGGVRALRKAMVPVDFSPGLADLFAYPCDQEGRFHGLR